MNLPGVINETILEDNLLSLDGIVNDVLNTQEEYSRITCPNEFVTNTSTTSKEDNYFYLNITDNTVSNDVQNIDANSSSTSRMLSGIDYVSSGLSSGPETEKNAVNNPNPIFTIPGGGTYQELPMVLNYSPQTETVHKENTAKPGPIPDPVDNHSQDKHVPKQQDQNLVYLIQQPIQTENVSTNSLNDSIPQENLSLLNWPHNILSNANGKILTLLTASQVLVPSSMINKSTKLMLAEESHQELVLIPRSFLEEIITPCQKIDQSKGSIRLRVPTTAHKSRAEHTQKLSSYSRLNSISSKYREDIFSDAVLDDQDGLTVTTKPDRRTGKGNISYGNRKRSSNKVSKKDSKMDNNKPKKYDSPDTNNSKDEELNKEKIDLCKVCGNKATRHVHYGGRSCQSCRAFFRRSVIKSKSIPNFQYFCKCRKDCWRKEKPLCGTFETGQNQCKFCRFKRCREFAGMVDRWVLGAYKSLDENDRVDHIDASTNSLNGKNDTRLKQTENKEKKNNIEINSQTRKYDLSTAQATIDEMRLKYRNSFLTNCKVIKALKSAMKDRSRKIPTTIKQLLEYCCTQEMHHIALQFDEFKQLTFVTQMIKLVSQNKHVFMFLLPIVIFSPSQMKDTSTAQKIVLEHHLYFTQLLEKNILFHGKGDEHAGAIRFGIAVDLIHRFQEY